MRQKTGLKKHIHTKTFRNTGNLKVWSFDIDSW